jgi:predicted GNAT family acetyltransferase
MAQHELGVAHPRVPRDVIGVGVAQKVRVDVLRDARLDGHRAD